MVRKAIMPDILAFRLAEPAAGAGKHHNIITIILQPSEVGKFEERLYMDVYSRLPSHIKCFDFLPVISEAMTRGRIMSLRSLMKSSPG